ncbi:MAG: asparaginase [Acidobacteria bacterium]|nr:asparaginase [Acidobacteriota bacterium]
MPSRILLLHTGGTLGMAPSGEPTTLAPGRFLEALVEQVPDLRRLADLTVEVPFNCDSATLEPSRVLALAALIRERAAAFDGFVLIHGTDTMAFTASVLGFLLADLGKPVVLTGSQRPLAFARSDARSNLINAVDLACRRIAEVGIAFGAHWIRGVASDKRSVGRFEAFHSPNLDALAELGVDVWVSESAGRFERRVPEGLGAALEADILTLVPHPGMPWRKAPEGVKAVLIQAFGAGNLPMGREDLQAFLADARARGLPVVVTSQCEDGGVDLSAYELGRALEATGAIPGGLHTRWAALAKLGLLLGAGRGLDDIRPAFATSWAGEPMPAGSWQHR